MHIPVLQKEVLEYLDPKPNENFIDATIGNAGHTLTILERNIPAGKVLGIDADPEIIKNTKYSIQNTVYKNRVILVCDNFANLKEIVKQEKFKSVQGILFDLGMSSWHLEESGRGFSFLKNESLDMRYNPRNPLTAARIVNYYSSQEIEKILKDYGEERFAKKIAQKIIEIRKIKPIETTSQLAEIVKSATPHWYHRKKIHPATRTFQAIRIAVNDELNNLERALPQTLEILKPGGRLVVISFHSLEDRIIKNFLKEKAKENILKILTKKPIKPSLGEIKINPRSRSAKLRAAQKGR
ncbi:MAG: 16S rRNA (cytosine(1402)-N(4))-methyltransferase [Candidatus Nealsonbacteria bacterium CG01_land_8_20_14_3_00_12]|uniref:Ribosomal RNA small subunit methyltransferase H n=2 Tax=Candidatus Nealsoniibacteriota TaxID=1817911 RepID=A0A2M7EB99_9BACT|nr:MAG: 16S rRNA (cytosine(1402)-N(4))-methyltransferase [Candidatus Nealsonbacteria bacterium CG01_land_8_20_14_3_00_12]PJA83572.1 MAG: 16S rRNA (cytosine(1402)-N(4))-methyltransferase [Candidatus Nealsonbacteria bacterium CG_4_9_14_3_um_filter_37_29]